jgi:hypothetical protein
MKGLFNLNWTNIKSAVVYGLLAMALVFILSLAESILKAGSIFGLDWKALLDKGVIVALGTFVTTVSLIKNFLTTEKGEFLGVTTVIPDKTVKSE